MAEPKAHEEACKAYEKAWAETGDSNWADKTYEETHSGGPGARRTTRT